MSLVPFVHLDASLQGAVAGQHLSLSAAEGHHLERVLRLRPGAAVEVSDGRGGVAMAVLTAEGVELAAPPRLLPRRTPTLTVAQALPKGRKLDEVVRQVAELGADTIVPVQAERSVARPSGDRTERLRERAASVARAAAEQARSPWRCSVAAVTETAGLCAFVSGPQTVLLVAHPGAPALPSLLASLGEVTGLGLAIGPEGGWSDRELEHLRASGGRLVGLGTTVLRTEHAAAAALAVTSALLGRWSGDGSRAHIARPTDGERPIRHGP